MTRRFVCGAMLILLLIGMLTLNFPIQPAKAELRTRTVNYDGQFIQANSMIINGMDTYIISNGTFIFNDTIAVYDFAQLIIQNATITFDTTDYVVIRSYDNAIVEITNTEVNHAQGSQVHSRLSSTVSIINSTVGILIGYDDTNVSITKSIFDIVHCYGSSVVSITNTEVRFVGAHDTSLASVVDSIVSKAYASDHATVLVNDTTVNSLVDVYQFSAVSLTNSTIFQVCVYGLSVVLITNSVIDFIDGPGSSNFSVVNSTIELLSCWHGSVISSLISKVELRSYGGSKIFDSLPRGSIDYWNLGDLIIQGTQINGWSIAAYGSSIITVLNSIVDDVTSYGSSAIMLINSTVSGEIQAYEVSRVYVGWFLDVLVKNAVGVPMAWALVDAYWENATLLAESTTNKDGLARLVLYEKMYNTTGVREYGNYTVTATYCTYTNMTTIESITNNMEITIALALTIPSAINGAGSSKPPLLCVW